MHIKSVYLSFPILVIIVVVVAVVVVIIIIIYLFIYLLAFLHLLHTLSKFTFLFHETLDNNALAQCAF